MKEQSAQNFLSAQWGERRVTIGVDAPDELRRLSNARLLTCPGCGALVILHAGTVRTHHFAHLPGSICSAPQTEPETEEHRAGKLLLARWLRACLPHAQIVVEAHIQETNQRADILVVLPVQDASPLSGGSGTPGDSGGYLQDKTVNRFVARGQTFLPLQQRIAIEYQCANMQAKEWRRRHHLYRSAGIQDLWILGGSRLIREINPLVSSGNPPADDRITTPPTTNKTTLLRTGELERALLWDGAPLLFLDAIGENMPAETLARFRPDDNAQAIRPAGRLNARPLPALPFPFALLAWPNASHPDLNVQKQEERSKKDAEDKSRPPTASNPQLWNWLIQRHRVTPETLPGFFGLHVAQTLAFACEGRAWQAALYYRFVHGRVGDRWWLGEVETWTRAYLPLSRPLHLPRLRAALAEYQEVLAAAGFLSLPRGYNRVHATVLEDLTTLPAPPDPEEVLRLARYRRTLNRDARADYQRKR